MLGALRVPIVQAPLAGGASTPALTAAVVEAGGFGFVAAGYRTPDALGEHIRATRELTSAPFGVNVFVPGRPADSADYEAYLASLEEEARRHGVALGEPRFEDDAYAEKVELLEADPVAAVSFTFGCPATEVVARLQAAGSEVWVTVTDPDEADQAAVAGADALVVQGIEAGGHRASFMDADGAGEYGLLALLAIVAERMDLPLVATGGIATGAGVAAVLCAGARAAQLGTAFMLCPEAGTAPAHREALAARTPTRVTRAFTGRRARGIANRFLREHSPAAPAAYPEIHHATAPLRAAGRAEGDAEVLNLWAGQTHELARDLPAGELVATLAAEATDRLTAARRALGGQ
ncbi:MAG TPA: nitronate monooxygenase [Solirubrobacteraceae bacterium]